MTPHLVRNDESPQDLQNRQGTTAAASTSATSAIAAIAATTATMVGEVGDADRVDDESAKEDHGDGKVGDADPVHDESAEEDHIILSNSYNWIIEGVEELDEEKIRHMNAFYALLKKQGMYASYSRMYAPIVLLLLVAESQLLESSLSSHLECVFVVRPT
jgi:hypothetical protein